VLEDIPGRAGDATGQVDLCEKAGNNPEIARKPANVSPKSSPSKKPNRKLNNHVMVIEKVVVLPPYPGQDELIFLFKSYRSYQKPCQRHEAVSKP